MQPSAVIEQLPYTYPFLFVDDLEEIHEEGVTGSYTFPESAFFYQGHFKNNPVTPGVILSECMAQIGVVCLGIFLLKKGEHETGIEKKSLHDVKIALSNIDIDFFLPVFPGERVTVTSVKEYFRFQKLKCRVQMRNEEGKLVCKGEISGMIVKDE
jgi:3-hydroxyacyl-[acyl-carrier-protein] dehydratase